MNRQQSIDTILTQLDDFFSAKNQNEKYIIMALPLIVFGFLSYQLISPMTEEIVASKYSEMQALENKLTEDKSYMERETRNNDPEFFIKALQNEINLIKQDQLAVQNTRLYIDDKIKNEASFIVYNQQNWATFLNSISQRAAETGFKITYLNNALEDHNSTKLSKVLTIDVNGSGSFPKIMNFIDSIERHQLIVDIKQARLGDQNLTVLPMDAHEGVPAKLQIEIWGVDLEKH